MSEQISAHINIYPDEHKVTMVLDEGDATSRIHVEAGRIFVHRLDAPQDLDFQMGDPRSAYLAGLRLVAQGLGTSTNGYAGELIDAIPQDERDQFVLSLLKEIGKLAEYLDGVKPEKVAVAPGL